MRPTADHSENRPPTQFHQPQFVAPELGLFKVMSGESYFRNGSLPWMGFVTTAVLASALLYSAAETLERRDF